MNKDYAERFSDKNKWPKNNLTNTNLPDDDIYDIAIHADDTTLYSKCDQATARGNI